MTNTLKQLKDLKAQVANKTNERLAAEAKSNEAYSTFASLGTELRKLQEELLAAEREHNNVAKQELSKVTLEREIDITITVKGKVSCKAISLFNTSDEDLGTEVQLSNTRYEVSSETLTPGQLKLMLSKQPLWLEFYEQEEEDEEPTPHGIWIENIKGKEETNPESNPDYLPDEWCREALPVFFTKPELNKLIKKFKELGLPNPLEQKE